MVDVLIFRNAVTQVCHHSMIAHTEKLGNLYITEEKSNFMLSIKYNNNNNNSVELKLDSFTLQLEVKLTQRKKSPIFRCYEATFPKGALHIRLNESQPKWGNDFFPSLYLTTASQAVNNKQLFTRMSAVKYCHILNIIV